MADLIILPDFKVFWKKTKNQKFIIVAFVIIAFTVASYFVDVIAIGSIVIIDCYLFWLLLTSARLSTKNTVSDRRHYYLMSFFPGRIMGLILFFILLVGTAYMFSSLYHSNGDLFCSGDEQLNDRFDALCLSVGTITTVTIVNFSPITQVGKELIIWQLGTDVLLFIAAFPLLLSRISNFEDKPGYKLLRYNPNLDGLLFTSDNVEQFTGYPAEKWANFSGFFTRENVKKLVVKAYDFKFEGEYPELIMSRMSSDFQVKLTFSLNQNSIHANYFGLSQEFQDKGIGANAFSEFLRLSIEAGFAKVTCKAQHDEIEITLDNGAKLTPTHNGYYTWAAFGFTLDETGLNYSDVLTKIKEFDSKLNSIQDLFATENGKDYWKANGMTWSGVFILSPTSPNMKLWINYSSTIPKS